MDEATLTRALEELAKGPQVKSSPAADARGHARALQRRRRTGAVALVVVVGLGVVGVAEKVSDSRAADSAGRASDSALVREASDPLNPNHATSSVVLTTVGGHPAAVYWQGLHLCYATASSSACSSVNGTAGKPITVQNIGDGVAFVSLAPGVARLRASRPDGSSTTVRQLHAPGFPFAAGIVEGTYASLRAFDSHFAQLGDAVPGAGSLQLRPVREVWPCTPAGPGGRAGVPDLNGSQCYVLGTPVMNIVPWSATAQYDSVMGYSVQVTLSADERATFGSITRTLSRAQPPGNQLAMVLNGRVLSAPSIEEGIDSGQFQIMGDPEKPFTQQDVATLAKQLTQ